MDTVVTAVFWILVIATIFYMYKENQLSKLVKERKELQVYDDEHLYRYDVLLVFKNEDNIKYMFFSDSNKYLEEDILTTLTAGNDYLPIKENNQTFLLPVREISYATVSCEENYKLKGQNYKQFLYRKLKENGGY